MALAAAGASVYGASKQAKATQQASQSQQDAAQYAADLQWKQYQQSRRDLAPWRQAGQRALGGLEQLTGQPLQAPGAFQPGQPLDPAQFAFQAPTAQDMLKDPGYQFRLREGMKALEGSAAARGLLQSGGNLKGAQQYAQDFASQEYGNVYQRALGENALNYTRAQAQNTDQYGRNLQQYQFGVNVPLAYRQQQLGELQSLAGVGQSSATALGNLGAQSAALQGSYATQGANAAAAGLIGQANAWNQGLQGAGTALGSGLNNYLFMQQMRQPPPAYGTLPTVSPSQTSMYTPYS